MTDDPYTLTTKQVCRFAGITRQTLWRWLKADVFPKPKRINQRKLRWSQSDLDQWSAGRVAD